MNYYVKVLQNYVNFEGRARRSEYWYFFLFNIIISVALTRVAMMTNSKVSFLSNIYALATFLPALAVTIRRMHDVGKSGWFCLIPIYNIILCATAGDVGDNEYGADPKAEEIAPM